MSQEQVNRKLSCILSTDVVGYSRLMEENEASTVRYLEENKKLISKLIEDHNGRVVDSPGDNLLAEFSSAVKAVDCAVKIQKELKIKNAELVENRRMQFRIGINLGEVIEEDGRIYGSGVNIAARLEGLAEPGGICISKKVYDETKTKLDLAYDYLGEHEVKNITELVQVYRVQTGIVTNETIDKKVGGRLSGKIFIVVALIIIAGLLVWKFYPKKHLETEQAPFTTELKEASKTIAVLPFEDYSPEGDQEYFVLGLSEEILNSLTQIPNLTVTAKTSSFYFKGKDKTFQEIAKALDVEYILEGSVRKAGNAIRITAQLIKAVDESHLWSDTYDKEFKVEEMFLVQEDIATSVADELKVRLGVGKTIKKIGGTDNLESYEHYLIAKGQARNFEYAKALKSIDAALEVDQEFALAWSLKSIVHVNLSVISSVDQVSLELDAGQNAALRAIELEPTMGKAYLSLGSVYMYRGKFIEAEKAFSKGMELTAESIDGNDSGLTLHYWAVGYLKKCHELYEEMRRKDPLQPFLRASYMLILGYLGDIQGAEEEYERCKATLGDEFTAYGDFFIFLLRLGAKDVLSINEIPESPFFDPIFNMAKGYIKSPEDGLEELRRLYKSDENLSSHSLANIAFWATYFGDPELALNAIERSLNLQTAGFFVYWAPLFHEVRQLPRFKEITREIGLVDYWKEYGWPDLCRPIGDDDFECD